MKKVEYMTIPIWELKNNDNQFDILKLNLLGQKGWELVSLFTGEAIFQRKK